MSLVLCLGICIYKVGLSMGDAFGLFKDLQRAVSTTEFQAIELSSTRKDFLAKSENGAPIFLLHDASLAHYSPAISFTHVSAQFHATCHVSVNEREIEDQFCLVWCDSSAPELYELFVRCVGAAIEDLPADCGSNHLEAMISQLQDLFRPLQRPGIREISGLWAELFVIMKSGNIPDAVVLWHKDQFDRFDFSDDSIRVEVKATVRNSRTHEFSLHQLEPGEGIGRVISILLQRLSTGASILDLAQKIENGLLELPELRRQLWRNVAETLGADFSDKLDQRFDLAFAEKSLIVYDMVDVPRPEIPKDLRVTEVRFVSDLTTVKPSVGTSSHQNLLECFGKSTARVYR